MTIAPSAEDAMPESDITAIQPLEAVAAPVTDAVYAFAARQMNEGVDAELIERALLKDGLDWRAAHMVMEDLGAARRQLLHEAGIRRIAVGALCCLGALAIAVMTATPTYYGDGYSIAWMAIVLGGLQALRGLLMLVD